MLLLSRPVIETLEEDDTQGRFLIGPLERGFGHTLGNSLRRTLLSSIPGAAITKIQMDGAIHEFSVIDGVVEDVSEIILNLKDLVLKVPEEFEERELEVSVSGPAEVTGSSLLKGADDSDIEIMNPDLHIATVNSGCTLSGFITISRGRGFRQAGHAGPESTEGVVPVDAIFSPIRRVTFVVEETSGGDDQLIVDITTDETVSPSQAIASAASTLISLLGVVEGISEEYPQVGVEHMAALAAASSEPDNRPVEDLHLSERAQNCLRRAQINTIGELASRTPKQLMSITNFGEKSLREVKEAMAKHNLSLVEDIDIGSFSGEAGEGSEEFAGEFIGSFSSEPTGEDDDFDESQLDDEEAFFAK